MSLLKFESFFFFEDMTTAFRYTAFHHAIQSLLVVSTQVDSVDV